MRRGSAWLDGVSLGADHIGYMDSWDMDIGGALLKCGGGGGRLVVRVDNRANHEEGDCFSGCFDLRGLEARPAKAFPRPGLCGAHS